MKGVAVNTISKPIIRIDEDVVDFASQRGLKSELSFIAERFEGIFSMADEVHATIVDSPEDGGESEGRIMFVVCCQLDRMTFRKQCEEFYAGIRSMKIYLLMGIIKDV